MDAGEDGEVSGEGRGGGVIPAGRNRIVIPAERSESRDRFYSAKRKRSRVCGAL